jgi:cytochrome c oxidase subunit 3
MGLTTSLLPGLFFLFIQYIEYCNATFTISDGIYGSVFYMLTGLHGFHVAMGIVGLFVNYIRLLVFNNICQQHHIGFESAI